MALMKDLSPDIFAIKHFQSHQESQPNRIHTMPISDNLDQPHPAVLEVCGQKTATKESLMTLSFTIRALAYLHVAQEATLKHMWLLEPISSQLRAPRGQVLPLRDFG
jgi:hypothetical protein